MQDNRDKVIQLVKMKGPVLPVHITKDIGTNIMFASAMLSELVDSKLLHISNVKVGGSPLYYAPGQEYKLQNYSKYLHEKEQKAFEILKKNLVLRDSTQEPVIRAALRQIKDFAKPLEVDFQNRKEIFWKWYLLPNSETETVIKKLLDVEEEKPEERKEVKKEEVKKEEKAETGVIPQQREIRPGEREITKPKEEVKAEREEIRPQRVESRQEGMNVKEFVDHSKEDKFYRKVKNYFDNNRIKILNQNIIRKESEMEFIIEIPSSVGNLAYFCKAKNKKKHNDGDISSVFFQGQSKKLPILLLITGEMTKKAQDMLKADFKNMNVKHI